MIPIPHWLVIAIIITHTLAFFGGIIFQIANEHRKKGGRS